MKAASDFKAVKLEEVLNALLIPTVTQKEDLVKHRLFPVPEASKLQLVSHFNISANSDFNPGAFF